MNHYYFVAIGFWLLLILNGITMPLAVRGTVRNSPRQKEQAVLSHCFVPKDSSQNIKWSADSEGMLQSTASGDLGFATRV